MDAATSVRRMMLAADGKGVWSWSPDAGVKLAEDNRQATEAIKPGLRGERAISRKPLRREGRNVSAYLWLARVLLALSTSHTRLRVRLASGLPCALCFS